MSIDKEKKALARKIIFLTVLYHQEKIQFWKKKALRKQIKNNKRKLR